MQDSTYLGTEQPGKLLRLIGATDANLTLAHDYGVIIYAMMPLALVQNTLASIIRADGSPKYAMGASSFLTQLSIVVITVVNNILLVQYGAMSPYGADIPLAAFVVIMKLFQIVLNIAIGIAKAAVPLSFLRDVLLIVFSIVMPMGLGVTGIFWGAPITDVLAVAVTAAVMLRQVAGLKESRIKEV